MFTRKNMITIPLVILLLGAGYLTYIYLIAFFINSNNIWFLLLSLLLLLISIVGLFSHFKESSQNLFLNDLVAHIGSTSSSAQNIPKNRIMKDKLAYEYIKSNFNTLQQRESKINSEYKSTKAFLNRFSYDIRTPMNAISGYTKLLKETPLNNEQQDLIAIIENSYTNLDSSLSQMTLGLSLPKENVEVKNLPFNIAREVEASVETFSVKADEKDIVLGLYIDPDIPHNLLGEGIKIAHVLTHLIDNALAVSEEYATIDIRLENIKTEDNLAHIKFSISDEGVGVETEELEYIRRIFNDMEIVEENSVFNIRNLTISNRIIKRMGGTLEISSKKDEGTTFSFSLSYEKDNEEVDRKQNPIFKGLTIGLALPHKDINRQIDYNLQTYVEYLGGKFTIYGYDEISNNSISLPDLMFVYHSYAKNKGELDKFASLSCKTTLITSGSLRSHIDVEKHFFSSVVYAPITMSKILRTLSESQEKPSIHYQDDNQGVIHALVVEDNMISQTIIANILKNMNIDVMVASDGKEAYDLRREEDFDIIFMDIKMPVMDGFESTEKILAYENMNKSKHVPIIAFSADKISKKKYLNIGMDDLVSKPVHAEEIYQIVQRYCFNTTV